MKLGKGQKLVIAVGVFIGLGIILFPPQKADSATGDSSMRAGRKFLFASEKKIDDLKNLKASDFKNLRPDFGRLSTEMIIIGIATAVVVVVLGAFTAMARSR